MAAILIIYHSGYGHTKKQAEAVAEGSGGTLVAIDAEGNLPNGAWEQIVAATAIVFGAPTYMGGPSWQFKKFADASSKPWAQQHWKNKLAAGFTNSASINGDKFNTLTYFVTLAMQHSMIWVGTGMMPANTLEATRNDVNYLAGFTGALAQSPANGSPDQGPLPGDLQTARQFGARIAELARNFERKA